MLASAVLPDGKTLPDVLGEQRYGRAAALAHEVGVELSMFDQFAPWFAAEAISQLQLTQLGFQPEVRRRDVFHGAGAHRRQERGGPGDRPRSNLTVPEHVHWTRRPSTWCRASSRRMTCPRKWIPWCAPGSAATRSGSRISCSPNSGGIPPVSIRARCARNRKWVPKIEALLNDDKNYLVIVGTGHLVGQGSVIDLLKKDGIGATQR